MIRLRHLLEAALLRVVLVAVDGLSLDAAGRLGRFLARTWWRVDVGRRRVARDNVLRAGITDDPKEADGISRRSAEHFGTVVVESLKSAEILEDGRWQDHLELDIAPDVLAVLEDPEQALIMASGHFGNWEIAAQFLSRYKPVAGITRPMNNPRVEEMVRRRKPRYRFRPIPKYDSQPARLLEVLDRKEILALLTDQHAKARGMQVPFFGHPASTHTTAAMLHLVSRAPLCFASCRRLGPLRFELKTSPLIVRSASGKKREETRAILEELNARLEAEIRAAPDQYLWGHRRWRDGG